MTLHRLNGKQESVIIAALRIAADKYEESKKFIQGLDDKEMPAAGRKRLVDGFQRQADDATLLADQMDEGHTEVAEGGR